LEQEKTSRKEWVTPLNWNSEKWSGVYFSHADSSTLVPKRIAKMGRTLKFGKTCRSCLADRFLGGYSTSDHGNCFFC